MNETGTRVRAGRIQVSLELLHEILHLPNDIEIVRVVQPEKQRTGRAGYFEIVVRSDTNTGVPELAGDIFDPLPEILVTCHSRSTFDHMTLGPIEDPSKRIIR